MAKRYAIADYLTDEQRQRALAKTYTSDKAWLRDGDPEVGTWGNCPLGNALGIKLPCDSTEFLDIFGDGAAVSAAFAFIRAADTGEITPADLAVALGAE